MTDSPRFRLSVLWGICFLFTFGVAGLTWGGDGSDNPKELVIKRAKWQARKQQLILKGNGEKNHTVTVVNAFEPTQILGVLETRTRRWKVKSEGPSPVPCRVRAIHSNGQVAELAVKKAPDDCGPTSTDNGQSGTAEEAHASITEYAGPVTCVSCHEVQAEDMHGSVHYQQTGPTDYVTNILPTAANPQALGGERGSGVIGINTYCGTHENSPRFTCAGCHVGNGRFPQAELPVNEPARTEELSNIDCMMCHQTQYSRFPTGPFTTLSLVAPGANGLPDPSLDPILLSGSDGVPALDPVTQDFLFEPADSESQAPSMSISRLEAARTVHRTRRESCLNCHAKAGGGDGTKRGDLSTALVDPPLQIDMHMSSSGEGMTCSSCHDAGGHRVFGRGVDLRPNDVAEPFSCESCHQRPHGDFSNTSPESRDRHAMRVACQSCHIPTYAKGVPTEVSRDWEHPHFSPAACNGRGGWLPEEAKAGDLKPTYAWFDGTSEVYFLGESLEDVPTKTLADGSLAYVLGKPNGDVSAVGAKIHPMKEHVSKSARHLASNELIGHSTFEFFRTGSFVGAVEKGLEQDGRAGDAYDVVPVHTYQTINHGVEVADHALECGDCHDDREYDGGPARMDLQVNFGYELKGTRSVVCTQCHGFESSEGFKETHEEHVADEGYDCSLCHGFSRPERGLRMSR